MKKIHIIPTDKPSRLCFRNYLFINKDNIGTYSNVEFKNIYITSDEEITSSKDWFIDIKDNRNHLHQVGYSLDSYEWIEQHNPQYFKKIILTTDPDLIKDGVQVIDDEFLEWFVKNPTCESVEITKGSYNLSPTEEMLEKEKYVPTGTFDTYKIIIPKEETLEEAIDRIAKEDGYDIDGGKVADFVDGMVKGAKWQQERMYSEEEVRKMLWQLGDCLFNNCQNGIKEGEPETYFDDIISEFKKK
jgi:hypothetical protein